MHGAPGPDRCIWTAGDITSCVLLVLCTLALDTKLTSFIFRRPAPPQAWRGMELSLHHRLDWPNRLHHPLAPAPRFLAAPVSHPQNRGYFSLSLCACPQRESPIALSPYVAYPPRQTWLRFVRSHAPSHRRLAAVAGVYAYAAIAGVEVRLSSRMFNFGGELQPQGTA